MQIWKFTVHPGVFTQDMPAGAEILSVQTQLGKDGSGSPWQTLQPMMWAMVDPQNMREKRKFVTVGTGNEIPPEARLGRHNFLGTFQLPDQGLVFHLFEVR